MIQLKLCQVGDVVEGDYTYLPTGRTYQFTGATVIHHNQHQPLVLLGWNNGCVPAFALAAFGYGSAAAGYSYAYYMPDTQDVYMLRGCISPSAITQPTMNAIPQGIIKSATNEAKRVQLGGMHCCVRSCNTFNPYGEPNQPDGKSYRCYGCRQSWRSV